MMRWVICWLLLAGGALSAGRSTPNAAQRFAQLLQEVKQARQGKNAKAALQASLELAKLLHDSGPATEQVAMSYAEAGDQRHALEYLGNFAAMGQSDDTLASRLAFKNLRNSTEFSQILVEMQSNEKPIERAFRVARFEDANLLPEDLDYDALSKSFFVTSVLKNKIVRVRMDGKEADFARAPDGWPMLAIKVDSKQGVVWATEVGMSGFASVPKKEWGRSALICFRLSDGTAIRKIEGPPESALGDMTLLRDGSVIVSDGAGGGVYRAAPGLKEGQLERVDGGQFISPQTPAGIDGEHVFVPDYAGGVGVLDLRNKQVQWIQANRRHAMQGIDGLYLARGGLLATQNGTSPERVVFFGLDGTLQNVISEKVIERSTRTLGDPTHGVVVGNLFYYIANSGWNALDNNGKLKPGASMGSALIMATDIRDM